ncbi:MAG TPA: hypothetical protein ENK16_04740 [Chromatiales bacterium]|nr:hypothetical protein [Chromatiales bacterium]
MTTTLENWSLERDSDGVAWLCLDKPGSGANVLSQAVLRELGTLIDRFEASPPAGLVLYSGKDSGFIAGADISEFPSLKSEQQTFELVREGHRLLDRLEALPCPSVAVINGHALGGGLELALACDWRIAYESFERMLGLPEVNLGLHPGLGGTVRLVRLIGVRQAMPMMLTGKSVTPAQAKRSGLVDRICKPEQWRELAAELAQHQPPRRQPPRLDRLLNLAPIRPLIARRLRAEIARRARIEHYPAPYALIDLWQRHGASGSAAYEAEARSFARLVMTPTSRNLVRVYGLQERLKRDAGSKGHVAAHVHVVGAGVMGGDIAAWCALQGLSVTLQDREMQYIQPALDRASELFDKRLRGPGEADAARKRLVADLTGEGAASADIVIEAIFEDAEAKRSLYQGLEPRMKGDAILATNTSSIPLQELAPCLRHPERLVGLHFFNPVAKLPLVEVVSAPQTGERAAETGLAFAKQIGKLPLPCKSLPGFLVNRILAPYMAEALEMMTEGLPAAVIDQAAVDFGMPMGPIELADSVGLDISLHVARLLGPVVGREVSPVLEQKVEAGLLGRKTGEGFYRYRDGKPVRERIRPDSAPPETSERLILAYLNEAAACLAEQVVADADLVDAGAIFGTGFAPFRGGPLHYAGERGIGDVTAALRRLARQHGQRFEPSAGWDLLEPGPGGTA